MEIKACNHPGCIGLGKWQPVIEIKTPDNDRAFQFSFQYYFCDDHKDKVSLDDMVGPKNIKQLQTLFTNKFIHPPKKEHMSLKWDRVIIPIFDSNGIPLNHTVLNRRMKKD